MASKGFHPSPERETIFKPAGYRLPMPAGHRHEIVALEAPEGPADVLCFWPGVS